jgi:NAD(P)H-hydrate epimerase
VRPLVPVLTSEESSASDASAIARGIPSRALMQRAGAAAAGEIALRFRDRLDSGVLVLAGPGNNGGDAWVVAAALITAGVRVRVIEPTPSKTPDAQAERATAVELLERARSPVEGVSASLDRGEGIVVDGLLGTGSSGAPRGDIATAIEAANAMRARGAVTIALDVPSGMNASTGETDGVAVAADLTVTFASLKRGHVVNRGICGIVVVVDIGIPVEARDHSIPQLVDEHWVGLQVPAIPATAHKGTRKKVAIVGGAAGMAGAPILAARAAQRSGAGMVKLVVAPDSLLIVQESEPYALAATWGATAAVIDEEIVNWADVVVVGPGLGRGRSSRDLLDLVLARWRGRTLLDADALTLFEGRASDLAAALGGRPAILTPHPMEFARLTGSSVEHVLATRFDAALELARATSAVVLLKGVPTIITSPDGRRLVSAAGTPALATGGSGDVLSGIAGTLLGQMDDAFAAAGASAWIHGRAAERVPSSGLRATRGTTLEDVVAELRDAWLCDTRPARYPVLAELPAVGPVR